MTRIALVLVFAQIVFCQQANTGNASTTGTCSPSNTGNNNLFTINCGIGQVQGKKMLDILNRILANQLDPDAVMTKLDEIKQEVASLLAAGAAKSNVGPITAQPGSVISVGQQGGITAGRVEINPLPPERTWQVSISSCDEWMRKLDMLGPATVSIGAFMSNNDGMRLVQILGACFKRSQWVSSSAFLPVNPDGVVVQASVVSTKLEAVEAGLKSLGLRVTERDIRPAYGEEIGIVIGVNPIR